MPHRLQGRRLLMVDDCPETIASWRGGLQAGGVVIDSAGSMKECLGLLCREHYDCVLLDLNLPDSSGPQTVARVREAHPELPVIVVSGYSDDATVKECLEVGATDYLEKVEAADNLPLFIRTVKQAVDSAEQAAGARYRLGLIQELQREVELLKEGGVVVGPLDGSIERLVAIAVRLKEGEGARQTPGRGGAFDHRPDQSLGGGGDPGGGENSCGDPHGSDQAGGEPGAP